MGWISSSGSTLPTAGTCDVKTSKQRSSTILFCKSGQTTIRQWETETVTEYRGLDAESAQAKVAGTSDLTAQVAYYATFGTEEHSITVTTGTKTEVSAQRVNDANGWNVTVREVSYSVEPNITANGYTGPWKTSRVVSGGGTARTVSVNVSSTHIRTFQGVALYSTKTVTVKEHPGLSQSDAATLATTLANGTNVAEHVMLCSVSQTIDGSAIPSMTAWASLHTGKVVYATTRKVSDDEGYTVTETEEVYSWRQAGNGTTTSTSDGHTYSTTKAWSVYS